VAALVAVGGLAAGAAVGWALAVMLVRLLNGVFDPQPVGLAVPWAYLLLTGGPTLLAVAAAYAAVMLRTREAPMAVLRDL
jgi:putative ABC transport system permease protein